MNHPAATAEHVLEGYRAAVLDQNVAAFMHLYDPNAKVFDTWGVWSYDSAAARRKTIEDWFGSLGNDTVKVDFSDVQVTAGAELALVSATGTYTAFAADGKALRSMQNRFTWGLKHDGAGWKIIHEHTSVPIGFSDLKGILQRAEAG